METVDKIKFLTYYFVKVGWTCETSTINKVTDLTKKEIIYIKNNWKALYKIHVLDNNEDENCKIRIPDIERFFHILDYGRYIYEKINRKIGEIQRYYNKKMSINFEMLAELYTPHRDCLHEYWPARDKDFKCKQYQILCKLDQ